MGLEYPSISISEVPNTNNAELLYWLHRTNEVRGPLSKLYLKLPQYLQKEPTVVTLLFTIIRRELELTDSIFILAAKSRIKDVGVLFLNLYELTLDIQYISLNPGAEKNWLYNEDERNKPWRISELQKAIFKGDELDAEKQRFKHFSMIKHGNIAAKHDAFDVFIHDGKFIMTEVTETTLLPTLFGINSLLYRTFIASASILSRLNIKEEDILSEMNVLHNKYNETFIAVAEVRTAQLLHSDNLEAQERFIKKANMLIQNGG